MAKRFWKLVTFSTKWNQKFKKFVIPAMVYWKKTFFLKVCTQGQGQIFFFQIIFFLNIFWRRIRKNGSNIYTMRNLSQGFEMTTTLYIIYIYCNEYTWDLVARHNCETYLRVFHFFSWVITLYYHKVNYICFLLSFINTIWRIFMFI